MGARGGKLTLALTLIALAGSAQAQKLEQIAVQGIQPFSLFGESIGMDGSDMVVGARWDNEKANNAGAAYFYARQSGDLWEQVVKVKASDGRNSDYFGSDVALSGDWAIIGASGFNGRQGAAYAFQRSGDNWIQRQRLLPGSNSARSVFGASVAIDGNYIAIGAPDHFRSGEIRSGAVYVFALSSGTWARQAFIIPGDAGSVDYLGHAVALSGDLLAMSAVGDGQMRGSVYIYRRQGSSWIQQQKLIPGGGQVGDGFGTALAMDPNWLAIGSPHDDEAVKNQGSVYLYRRSGDSFVFDSKVTSADPRVSQMFGFSLSVSGSDLLVGAPGDAGGVGAAYRFERDGSGKWRQQVKFQSEPGNPRGAFGRAVGIGAQDMVMGSTGETGAEPQSGGVYSLGGGGILRQGFQNIEASLAALQSPDLSFADIDGDGDLDVAAYGVGGSGPTVTLYTNEGADQFKASPLTFQAPSDGFVGWVDVDNSGSMDLVAAGQFQGERRTDIYLNDGKSAFSRVNLGIPGLAKPKLAWGDYDSDGDLDLMISGLDSDNLPVVTLLEHKPGHNFVPSEFTFPGLQDASFDWGDFDNDGDPDLLLSGKENGTAVVQIYENRKTSMRLMDLGLPAIVGKAQWVDVTADGFLDVFLCGVGGDSSLRAALLRNEDQGSSFVDMGVSLPPLESCRGSWGDYDNDGDNDLVLSGMEFGTRVTDVYENLGEEGFDESRFKLSRVSDGTVEWVDIDRDGRLDLAIAGHTDEGNLMELYRNSVGFAENHVPDVPTNLRAVFDGTDVVLRWARATDDKTPGAALTYNLRIGSQPGGIDVVSPNTTRNGYRTLSARGNMGHARKFVLSSLKDGIYYWSVQAVDDGFAASEFAPEGSFTVGQSAQDFHDINAALVGVSGGSTIWSDFRLSGYLDVLLTGDNDRGPFTAMYRYRAKSEDFVESDVVFPAIEASKAAFGDYDNDEDLDVAMIGRGEHGLVAKIYRNDGRSHVTDISAPLVPASNGSIAWADLDNDGDLDLIQTGNDGTGRISAVFSNNRHDEFVRAPVSFVRLEDGSIDVGDFDGDSDNDVLLTGFDGTTPRSLLYRNDGFPRFTQISAPLVGVRYGEATFGDYDGDGDLDILVSGRGIDGPVTQLYENRGTETYYPVPSPMPELEYSSIAWGDYDNNGKMDVLLSGSNGSSNITQVYRYMGAKDGFQILHIVDLPATRRGAVATGDFDRDGRLDMLVSGEGSFFPTTRIVKNQLDQWVNTPPSKPTGLSYRLEGNKLILFWQASQDAETPSSSLTYDLRVSTTHSGSDIMAPNTRPNGDRISVMRGNVGNNRRWTIMDPPAGRITVSVHAVDGGYMASQSSDKMTLEIGEDQSAFTTAETAFPGIEYGQATWADLDGDGDQDINIVGGAAQEEISAQFLNDGDGQFTEVDLAIPPVAHATTAWGDYDNDGDEDLFVNGEVESGFVGYILRNDSAGVFIDIEAPLDPVEFATASWADYDVDGDRDLIVSGNGLLGPETVVYRNDGNDTFVKTDVQLPAVFKASHAWADYDKDGDLDLLLTGSDGTFPTTKILRNNRNGIFEDAQIPLVDVFDGTGDWVDADNDGDVDILITGHAVSGVVATMFLNAGSGSFFEVATPFPGVRISSTDWGDFDSDGDLDLAIAGWDGLARLTKVFANTGNANFVEVFTNMDGISVGSVEWTDADGDGDLDLLVAGASEESPITSLYLFDSSLGSGIGNSSKLTTGTEENTNSDELPLPENGFLFKQAYPNPFVTSATVNFAVGRVQRVRMVLYNVIGQVVETPFDQTVRPNEMMTVRLNARGIASGAYFLRIDGESFADTQTVIVNK